MATQSGFILAPVSSWFFTIFLFKQLRMLFCTPVYIDIYMHNHFIVTLRNRSSQILGPLWHFLLLEPLSLQFWLAFLCKYFLLTLIPCGSDSVSCASAYNFAAIGCCSRYLGGVTYLIYKLPFVECMMFGALISSTDPITVLAIFQVTHFFVSISCLMILVAILCFSIFYMSGKGSYRKDIKRVSPI